jgi:hypothetical protein
MVAKNLTTELIDEGKKLITELDSSGCKPNAALWFYFPEERFWKLVLSFPNVEKEGPKHFYTKIQKLLLKVKVNVSFSLDDIVIAKPNSPLIQLLSIMTRTGPGISNIRISNSVINGHSIEDAHIYRLL